MNPDPIPSFIELRQRLFSEFVQLMERPSAIQEQDVFPFLEKRATGYILASLQKMGWKFDLERSFSTAQMASTLSVIKRHHRLLERFLIILADDGMLRRSDSLWETIHAPASPEFNDRAHSLFRSDPQVLLLDRCGSALPEVLQGKCDPLQLLFPNGDSTVIGQVYRDAPGWREFDILIEKTIAHLLQRRPATERYRILEIGAGTGGATYRLLPSLSRRRTEYAFTDVFSELLLEAQEKFRGYDFLEYRTLNIELDPQKQGFNFSHYDLAIAANVFHATADLARTIRNTRQLLKPEGCLILFELAAPIRWIDLVFGTMQGWWRFTDTDLRPSHPLMPAAAWIEMLNRGGFEQAFSISTDDLAIAGASVRRQALPASLIVAKAAGGKA